MIAQREASNEAPTKSESPLEIKLSLEIFQKENGSHKISSVNVKPTGYHENSEKTTESPVDDFQLHENVKLLISKPNEYTEKEISEKMSQLNGTPADESQSQENVGSVERYEKVISEKTTLLNESSADEHVNEDANVIQENVNPLIPKPIEHPEREKMNQSSESLVDEPKSNEHYETKSIDPIELMGTTEPKHPEFTISQLDIFDKTLYWLGWYSEDFVLRIADKIKFIDQLTGTSISHWFVQLFSLKSWLRMHDEPL